MAGLTTIDSLLALNRHLANHQLVVVHMFALWSEPCKHMDSILEELANIHPTISFARIDAEDVVEVSEKFEIVSVPCFLFFKGIDEVDRLTGATADVLTAKVAALARGGAASTTTTTTTTPSLCEITTRCDRLVKSAHVMLFMKGTPDAPRCGFSRRVVEALQEAGCTDFGFFDILTDEDIHAGIKQYSNWPTYPQLYVGGELLGGCDIVQELKESGELAKELGLQSGKQEDLTARLKALVSQHPVMLFMKVCGVARALQTPPHRTVQGTPDAPRCGFSQQVVSALQDSEVAFGSFDILTDEAVRAGLKSYSDWPTYPQLYAGGQLVGGCDIVQELAQAGELKSALEEMGVP